MKSLNSIEILKIIGIAQKAGDEIMKFYDGGFSVEYKEDSSPLTSADLAANKIIYDGLTSLYPDIPFLSEEGTHSEYEIRKNWPLFWLIDPLDGTKEFVQKNGDFTVNIALIENQTPVLGVVYAPAKNVLYYAKKGQGAWKGFTGKIDKGSADENTLVDRPVRLPLEKKRVSQKKIIVASRLHMSPETHDFIASQFSKDTDYEIVSVGSSLKICLVAEGAADMYPRLGPTMEWDTAAAHAVVLEAGKHVLIMVGSKITPDELIYNKINLLNPWFVVY